MSEVTKLARPYAAAVFELALEKGEVSAWFDTLKALVDVTTIPQVKILLSNPNIAADALAEVFIDIAGKSMSEAAKNFVRLLGSNGRLALLPEIARLYEIEKSAHERAMNVTLTSAVPLQESFVTKLGDKLGEKFNKQAVVHCEIDESLIGGLLIRTGDMVIDGSIRGELSRLKEALMG